MRQALPVLLALLLPAAVAAPAFGQVTTNDQSLDSLKPTQSAPAAAAPKSSAHTRQRRLVGCLLFLLFDSHFRTHTMAEVYRGAVLRANPGSSRSSCRCTGCHDPNTMFQCTVANGSIRHFHTRCLPTGLLLHATANGRYYDAVEGLSKAVNECGDEPTYLQGLDERLKKDCADVTQRLEGNAASPRELGLFLDEPARRSSRSWSATSAWTRWRIDPCPPAVTCSANTAGPAGCYPPPPLLPESP